jgi:predicted nucleic-acid-binding Zn-ribbon protein
MKNTQTCPKCASKKLWLISPLRTIHEYAPGTHPLNLDYDQKVGNNFLTRHKAPAGKFDAWVCAECGFSELWATDIDKLVHAPERGIRLIQG